jgi:hypothetical protein
MFVQEMGIHTHKHGHLVSVLYFLFRRQNWLRQIQSYKSNSEL